MCEGEGQDDVETSLSDALELPRQQLIRELARMRRQRLELESEAREVEVELAGARGAILLALGYLTAESEASEELHLALSRIENAEKICRRLVGSSRQDGAVVEVRKVIAAWGTETILLLESANQVRRAMAVWLERQGYTVISTVDANDAWGQLNARHGCVDLLVTDLRGPGLCGESLFRRLLERQPDLKVLYMTDENAPGSGGIPSIRKPFTPARFALEIREALAR